MDSKDFKNLKVALMLGFPTVLIGAVLVSPSRKKDVSQLEQAIKTSESTPITTQVEQVTPSYDLVTPNLPRDSIYINYARLEETLKRHEGVRDLTYRDIKGNFTIGIGFNLEKGGARARIRELGLDYDSVLRGTTRLTQRQIDLLFGEDLSRAITDAEAYVGKEYWKDLDGDAKEVITNMAFNIGLPKLSGFVRMREALRKQDYARVADEMIDSKWYHQIGNRSKELVDQMRNAPNN